MSGFLALVHLDGSPVDPALLDAMTATMTGRGPDASRTQTLGHVGLGHTLLRTTSESRDERQPWTIDGRTWIAGDVRIDARADLLAALARSDDVRGLESRPDCELILHAYRVWGETCVDRLLGDFAFAIWDGDRQRLFCARDHIGIKPCFYAHTNRQLIVASTIDAVRAHPSVSSALNETAIADFLVVGANQDAATTVFSEVRRLRAAHTLTASATEVTTRRYWTLPIDEPVRFRRTRDYVERFQELLGMAVADRLRVDRAGIYMSGGVDSTSVALAARRIIASNKGSCDLHAFTLAHESLIPDDEGRYASIAAAALGLPIHIQGLDQFAPYGHWNDPDDATPEPARLIFAAADRAQNQEAARHSRVMLTGYGGDPLFLYQTDMTGLLKKGRVAAVAADVANALVHRRLPPIGVRTTLRRLRKRPPRTTPIPTWLDTDVVTRLKLVERYRSLGDDVSGSPHPVREDARRALLDPRWTRTLESCDAAWLGVPLECRHPFFDLRLIRYVFAIPPVPWSQDKELLRSAMIGGLPDEIRLRPKTPLPADPLVVWCRDEATRARLGGLVTTPRWRGYARAFPPELGPGANLWGNLRPVALEYWLNSSRVALDARSTHLE